MKIKIITSLDLGLIALQADGSLEVSEGASVNSVVNTFAIDPELKRYLPVAVNGELVDRSYQLQADDELTILLPASGG